MNTFYDTKTSVTTDEVSTADNNDVTFATKMFTSKQTASNNYYSINDPLYGLYTVNSQTSVMYFPLPKPNFSGICNFNKPALYLENETTE